MACGYGGIRDQEAALALRRLCRQGRETVSARTDLIVGVARTRWRVDVAILPDAPDAAGSARYFTYREQDGALVEEHQYRNLHPMLGKRNDLWRLQNYDVERLPSVEDVYLFRGRAKENPRWRRASGCMSAMRCMAMSGPATGSISP